MANDNSLASHLELHPTGMGHVVSGLKIINTKYTIYKFSLIKWEQAGSREREHIIFSKIIIENVDVNGLCPISNYYNCS